MNITTDDTNPAALEFDHVYAGYTRDLDILQDVSFTVPDGALRGLIGLNGAGKSTLLMAAIGFVRSRRGRIQLYEADISNISPHHCIGRGLYMLPQQSSLFPYLSVRQNLEFITRQRNTDIAAAVERFTELGPYLRWKAGNLSGGWQKMVEFAKALLAEPRVLLIDEPTVGLSPGFARRVYDWIGLIREQRNMSILLVDHNIEQVVKLASYVYVLSLGRIVAQGRSEELSKDLRGEVQKWLGLRPAP
jgi:branched-chain amino acid transport system ATP-binding protein